MNDLELFLQGECSRDIRIVTLPQGATVRDLVAVAVNHGLVPAGDHAAAAVFIEDAEDVLALDSTLEAAGIGRHCGVHVHRCQRIHVTVHHNGAHRQHTFTPGTTVHRVKAWATGKHGFNLTTTDAAEHVLQLTGTHERPDEDVHIGVLVTASRGSRPCTLDFDLVPKIRVEG